MNTIHLIMFVVNIIINTFSMIKYNYWTGFMPTFYEETSLQEIMTTKAKTSLFFGEMGGMIFVGCVGRWVKRLEFSRPKLPGAYFKVIV